jgi:hypothetical protein
MEIITALVGISFALFLAALAVTPTLVRVYLELRVHKLHGRPTTAGDYITDAGFCLRKTIFAGGDAGLSDR